MKNYLEQYVNDLNSVLQNMDEGAFSSVIDILVQAYRDDKQIFICGNGGSAGTANHFVCDFGKNAVLTPGKRRFRIISVCDNIEKVTALGNDFCYGDIFKERLKNLMNDGDVILLISASGNSENIVRAAEYVKARNGKVIGFTGFSGGKLGKLSDVEINVPSDSYEKIEDIHLLLTHMIVCCFKEMRLGEGWEV